MNLLEKMYFLKKYLIVNEVLNVVIYGIGVGLSIVGLVILFVKGVCLGLLIYVVFYVIYGFMLILFFLFLMLFYSLIFIRVKKVF